MTGGRSDIDTLIEIQKSNSRINNNENIRQKISFVITIIGVILGFAALF